MKGWICEQAGQFAFRDDLPEPSAGPGEAIVRIRRIGICGTDYHAFAGNQPFFEYPRILGHELAGTIEAVGSGVSGVQPGDRVGIIPYLHCGVCQACRRGKTNCCTRMQVLGVHRDGGMRERIAVPATHLIPAEGLSLDACAMLEPLAIGAHAVRRSGLTADDTVLVVGAGPIGLGVMALARYAGARVYAMDVNEERLAFCRSWAKVEGAVQALSDPIEQLKQLTNGELPSVVLDATGHAGSMQRAFELTGHGGTLVFVGLVKGDISFHDPEFHKRELSLLGSRNATKEDFEQVRAAIAAGFIDMERYVTHRCGFDDMGAAFTGWMRPGSGVIKAVVEL